MAAVTTTTVTAIGLNMLWLFLPTLIIGFMVSFIKCKNYRCSIKYGLLTGAIIGAICGFILSLFLMPISQNFDISVNASLSSFAFSLNQSYSNVSVNTGPNNTFIIISVMAMSIFINMVIAALGGLISEFIRKNKGKSNESIK
ncbi:MAG TPA: hypothetical protein VHO92_04460 [Methanobacterium sp.]|nr:hypothetical protein [Methanobacterium sp.]